MSKPVLTRFKVFGGETKSVKAGPKDTLTDTLTRLEMLPDDYIITLDGKPVPCDSIVEKKDYVLYKVASGG